MSLEDRVRATGLLDEPVVVLLSGGRDSVCLLDLAVTMAPSVHALHVNYRLRDVADGDESHCRTVCERLGVELTVRLAGEPSGNVQAWARDVRYAAAAEFGCAVAVGHTATDQVETVLYRLAASPGRRALLGMRPRRDRIVRPLLGVTREETAAHCAARGLPFVDDASNDSPAYARNRARAGLVPALRELHPAAEANVLRTLEILRDESEVLDNLINDIVGGRGSIPAEELAALPPALRRLIVGEAADELIRIAGKGGTHEINGTRIEYGQVWLGPAREFNGGTLIGDTDGLTVRTWQPGDRMRPKGLGGSKSLQDIFTDRKVPKDVRRRVPVVLRGEEIVWIPGVSAEGFTGSLDWDAG